MKEVKYGLIAFVVLVGVVVGGGQLISWISRPASPTCSDPRVVTYVESYLRSETDEPRELAKFTFDGFRTVRHFDDDRGYECVVTFTFEHPSSFPGQRTANLQYKVLLFDDRLTFQLQWGEIDFVTKGEN